MALRSIARSRSSSARPMASAHFAAFILISILLTRNETPAKSAKLLTKPGNFHRVMASSLANKWVLITGASSGFGAAAALAFARRGARLLLGARRLERLQDVVGQAKKAGAPEAQCAVLDVAQTSGVNAFVAWAGKFTDKLDVLINNAGGAKGLDTVAEGKDAD